MSICQPWLLPFSRTYALKRLRIASMDLDGLSCKLQRHLFANGTFALKTRKLAMRPCSSLEEGVSPRVLRLYALHHPQQLGRRVPCLPVLQPVLSSRPA